MTIKAPQGDTPSVELSVIIVNWNSKDFLRKCLASMFACCSRTRLEVIVVDGASYDGCGEMLAREFPSVIFIQSDQNLGFAKANNVGARHAQGEFLLLLNPDTEFIEDSIAILHARLAALPQAGAAGCRLLNSDRTLQTTCILTFPTALNRMLDSEFLRRRFPRSRLWGMAPLFSGTREPAEVEAISGACILIRRNNFERVGGFTESYFMYGEDVDLCFKLWRAGLRVFHVPETSIVHFGGGSSQQAASNFSTVMMRESWYQFMLMHRGLLAALTYRFSMLVTAILRLLFIGPLLLFGNRLVRHGANSWYKWYAVMRWCLGLESHSQTR